VTGLVKLLVILLVVVVIVVVVVVVVLVVVKFSVWLVLANSLATVTMTSRYPKLYRP